MKRGRGGGAPIPLQGSWVCWRGGDLGSGMLLCYRGLGAGRRNQKDAGLQLIEESHARRAARATGRLWWRYFATPRRLARAVPCRLGRQRLECPADAFSFSFSFSGVCCTRLKIDCGIRLLSSRCHGERRIMPWKLYV